MINRLTNKFKRYVVWRIILVSVVLMSLSYGLTMVLVTQISKDYATLYTSKVVCNMESYLSTKNVIVDQLDKMDSLYVYLDHPTPENLARLNEDVKKINVSSNEDILFFADTKTRSMHFWKDDGFEFVGTLDEQVPEDQWFYRSLSSKSRINLNIDRDRFIDVFNVWINYQMFDEGHVIGICGVGLSLDQFLKEIHFLESNQGAQSIVVNQFGAIQIAMDQSKILQNSFSAEVPLENSLFSMHSSTPFREEILNYFTTKEASAYTLNRSEFDYAAIENIDNSNWHVLTFFKSQSLVDYWRFLPLFLFILLFLGVLLILVIQRFDKLLGKPFIKLVHSLNPSEIESQATVYGLERNDEFGEIARSIEKLSKKWVQDIPVGVFHITDSLEILYANKVFLSLFGSVDIQELNHAIIEKPHTFFASKDLKFWLIDLMRQKDTSFRFEMEFANQQRENFWADVRLLKKDHYFEGTMIPINERRAHVNSVVDIAKTDALTGLINLRGLHHYLVDLFKTIPEQASLILVDIDRFKWVIKMYGHDVCDHLLVDLVEVLEDHILEPHLIARGDSGAFVIVLPETPLTRSSEIAEQIRAAIESFAFESVAQITASFAVTPYLIGDTVESIVTRLDNLKHIAKAKGRNRVEAYQYMEIPIIHMPWQTQYESGHDEIDSEHRLLFEMVNIAMTDNFKHLTPKHQLDELQKIVNMVKMHFKNEEATLERYQYPESLLSEHVLKHMELVKSIEEKLLGVLENHARWIDFYMYLISDVVYKHMIEEDQKFFEFLKKNIKNL